MTKAEIIETRQNAFLICKEILEIFPTGEFHVDTLRGRKKIDGVTANFIVDQLILQGLLLGSLEPGRYKVNISNHKLKLEHIEIHLQKARNELFFYETLHDLAKKELKDSEKLKIS